MARTIVIIAVILLSCGASHAQTTSAIGTTSPLGIPGSSGSIGSIPTGIPLGATEIDPGGLSPAVSSNCNTSGSSSSALPGTSSTFDGGGSTAAGPTSACTSGSISLSTSGTASPLSTPGTSAGFTLNGGTISLGATEIDNGGISPIITIPPPTIPTYSMPTSSIPTSSSSATPCAGSTTTGLSLSESTDTVGAAIPMTIGTSTLGSPSGC